MLTKNNLMTATIGAAFLFAFSATAAQAADAATENQHHQHHSAKSSDKDTGGHHGHQCDHKMSAVDTDKDGKINKEEFIKHHEQMFEKMDTNKDGFLDDSEMHHMMDHKKMHDHGSQSKDSGSHSHSKK